MWAAELQMLSTSREFCGIQYWRVISDTMGHMSNDTLSDTLIVSLTVIEIVMYSSILHGLTTIAS